MPFRKPVIIAALLFGALMGGIAGYIFAKFAELPDVKSLEEYAPPVSTKIYSDDGRLIGELFQEKRELLSFEQLPPDAINAVLAAEDAHFWRHKGVRALSLFRALLADIRARRLVQGGSTITQQLAKTLFLTPEKTLSRKLNEMMIALQLELNYTKQELLTTYFNQIYFGSGAYGLEAASQVYFGKSAKDLTLAECALIGALPRGPSLYSPYSNMGKAKERRSFVLARMKAEGFITEEARAKAEVEPIALSYKKNIEYAPYFLELVRQELETRYGSEGIYRRGLEVRTTLNIEMQVAAQDAVAKGVKELEERIAKRKGNPQKLPVQGALIAIEPATGEIKAMVGGTDFRLSQFNRAVQARRQPGSAFKPLLYATALENGYTPASILVDSPLEVEDPAFGGSWKPVNYQNRFFGPVPLRYAITHSLNLASVKLLLALGTQKVIAFARRDGITTELTPYPSLALGGSEVTLKELTSAYSAFANRGQRANPLIIRSVRSKGGAPEETSPAFTEVTSAKTAYLMSSLLQSVVREGTGRVAQKAGRPVAAKTGTTDEFTDAWFVGYAPQLAAGVWVGFDVKKSLGEGETGAKAAGPIWTEFMATALKGREAHEFEPPDGIEEAEIDPVTGLLADPRCGPAVMEIFAEGTQPVKSCTKR
ncbi:MAG: PBP1A family penicillin-binding protein [Nitrospinae bacterium]|nr:PBP1A family penicillin-binding protein [Nitrospinota bacterium]